MLLARVVPAFGNCERECAAHTPSAFNRHPPVMQFDELLYQGEANAGPLIGASQSSFDAMEPLKQVRQLLRGNSHSGIADLQLHAAVPWLNAPRNLPLHTQLEALP